MSLPSICLDFATTQPLSELPSIANMATFVTEFLRAQDLLGADVVGSSMGARLVLELARRGVVGSVVSLDPGGFWKGRETAFFGTSVGASIKLIRAIRSLLPTLAGNPVGRTLLLAQFSAHPWKLPAALVLQELQNYAASPSFEPMLKELVYGPPQDGATPLSDRHPITIGWGRYDRVCFTNQAARARAAFPKAHFHWFERSGHFPMWDSPDETAQLILSSTGMNAS